MKLLETDVAKVQSTGELLISSVITFSTSKDAMQSLFKWITEDKIVTLDGKHIDSLSLTTEQKHSIVKKLHGSKDFTDEQRKQAFDVLREVDKTDMIGRTEKYCEAALPSLESKQKVWDMIFAADENLPLLHLTNLCIGFNPIGQRELLAPFGDKFFEDIEECVCKKAYAKTRYIYLFLQPNKTASEEEIARFEKMRDTLDARPEAEKREGNDRLLKWIKESIQDLYEKRDARKMSSEWEAKTGRDKSWQ